ncbi:hypothetical protein TNCV_4745781 [Trichonephila clavipes]|nr:hypothetical protein TNCV_4745781 [Trichonephila clavipes]
MGYIFTLTLRFGIQLSPNLEITSGISRQIWKWQIVNPDDPDQDNGTKLLNYCIAIGPSQVWWPRWPSGQGIGSWLVCHEFEPSTTKDPPCRTAMHAKSVES